MRLLLNPTIRTRMIRISLLGAVAATLSACAQVYSVKVDALRSPEVAPRRSYRLESRVPERLAIDPQYAEAEMVVELALEAHGLIPASRPEWADLVILVDYGVGPRHLKAVPDAVNDYGHAAMVFIPDPGPGNVTEATGMMLSPTMLKRMISVCEKKLSLSARENLLGTNASETSGVELWRVEVCIEDQGNSVTDLLPVLGAALVEHIDTDTGATGAKQMTLSRKDTILLSANR